MKKVLSVITTIFLCLSLVGCVPNKNDVLLSTDTIASSLPQENAFHFGIPKNIQFKMKESEVIAVTGDDYTEYNELIAYDLSLGKPFNDEISYNTIYGFSDSNELSYINYGLLYDSTDLSKYDLYSHYILIQELLIKEHGDYSNTGIDWYDDRYKEDLPSWNKAFRSSHAKATTDWTFNDFVCTLKLDKDGVSVSYYNSEFLVFYNNFQKKISKYNILNQKELMLSNYNTDLTKDYELEVFSLSDSKTSIDIEVRLDDDDNIQSTAVIDPTGNLLDLFLPASIYSMQLSDKTLGLDLIKETLPKLIGEFQKSKELAKFENDNISVLFMINEKRGCVLLIENK